MSTLPTAVARRILPNNQASICDRSKQMVSGIVSPQAETRTARDCCLFMASLGTLSAGVRSPKHWRRITTLLCRICVVMAGAKLPMTVTMDETLATDFASLMEGLGHSSYHVMAHDMGAPPALLLAANYPDRVTTLTYLEEPAMLPDNIANKIKMTRENTVMGGLWWWMMAQSPSMTETLVLGNELGYISWFYDKCSAIDDAVTERARQIFAPDLNSPRDDPWLVWCLQRGTSLLSTRPQHLRTKRLARLSWRLAVKCRKAPKLVRTCSASLQT